MSVINDGWKTLVEKYDIVEKVKKDGLFYITADQIREVKEPRLMTKFDTQDSLPGIFIKHHLAILPVTRGKYAIGEFSLYQPIPDTKPDIKQITSAKIPDYYETININDIRSEANAINVMSIAGILDDFFEEENMIQTVSGRMSSENFTFNVYTSKGVYHTIDVANSQVEVDGGFENPNVFTIIEGKNVVHSDFLVRQLYYPTRLWRSKIVKPIRPIFMVYSNNIFRLMEYEFTDITLYNSIKLVKERSYSLEDIQISLDDIVSVYKATKVKPEPDVTFIQADSFNKVISLVERLNDNPLSTLEIADLFGFKERQSDYYYNAAKYLGLAEKRRNDEGIKVYITTLGKKLLKLTYKKRQLEYVRLIFGHQIFYEMFDIVIRTGEVPDKAYIGKRILELGLCDKSFERRASSVRGWLFWILNLISE